MVFIRFLPILLVVIAGCLVGNVKANSDEYKVKKIDVSDPSCKYVIGELVGIDQKIFNISAFFPSLQRMSLKYKTPEKSSRKKRDLSVLLEMLNSNVSNEILDSLERIFKVASPCLRYFRDYLKFWIHDVSGTIMKDQWNRFFELN